MTTWRAFADELDRWAQVGAQATFWWRDDDAGRVTDPLRRLVDLSHRHQLPLTAAVVPAWIEPGLVSLLADCDVAQHGYAHVNHAPAVEKKSEFGAGRVIDDAVEDLRAGRRVLADHFGDGATVLVPPWNRISPALAARLPGEGFCGLSTFAAPGQAAHGDQAPFRVVDTQIDVIAWRADRGFIGEATALGIAVTHLEARRALWATAGERGSPTALPTHPTGLLTHHAVHDAATWHFLEAFLEATCHHPAACWLNMQDVFAGSAAESER